MTHICMLAAENDTIPGGKVGGIGDVVRDIPRTLASQGATVTVIIPAYGAFHRLPGATLLGVCTCLFRGRTERIEVFELFAERDPGVRYLVIHHPLLAAGGVGRVYCDDDADQPFATDANKFALFCVASLSVIQESMTGAVDVLHLHDWHTGLAAALIKYDHTYQSLQELKVVFSIHNLALQGIRPFAENPSSLQAWFPHLQYDPSALADPRWPQCVNPIASAIRLADVVHTVSPTYAREIVQANDAARGFHGGEGLEADLQMAATQGRLVGIINGIDYDTPVAKRMSWAGFMQAAADEMLGLIARKPELRTLDYTAHQRLLRWANQPRPAHIITSVGRLTDQKMALLLQPLSDGRIPLDIILTSMSGRGMLLLLGSGDTLLEQHCRDIATRHPHFIFLNQYSQTLSDLLFSNGDLFLMPSSFEPCGISQMLAMRHAQPCLAHAVGGLCDTIDDDVDGFLFSGDSLESQSTALLQRLDSVLSMREKKPDTFRKIAAQSRLQRFEWHDSASRYLSELYS
ncbi:glycogen synthase [Granulosicoccus antarcticus]|uniref:starch synthase n=1 Tax=Granulosicoccus antarcticus IMCC3135 TaxID=1192854 RepID=A0A2Z2NM63_9GAMM|nr:glycogen/starch synthase [Granulosicoccus antarcticus]ASJ72532.1 Glycogen synthase [Granulosicoccus antarcticus IMCC3135]